MPKPIIGITAERWSVSAARPDLKAHGVLHTYVDAVQAAGGLPLVIPLSLGEADVRALYPHVDGVLVPGGGDIAPSVYRAQPHPATNTIDDDRDRIELALTRQAVDGRKPFLGICRGVQVFNVALGGTLYQDLPSEVPESIGHYFRAPEYKSDHLAHSVQVEEDSLLARVLGAPIVQVNSRHHQALKDLAPGLEIVARAPDQVVEAVEYPDHPFALGVQWHPENLQAYPAMRALFEKFVQAAAGGRG